MAGLIVWFRFFSHFQAVIFVIVAAQVVRYVDRRRPQRFGREQVLNVNQVFDGGFSTKNIARERKVL